MPSLPGKNIITRLTLVFTMVFVTGYTCAQSSPKPLQPTLAIDQIRTGMTGYGLSVFHGAKIEPFPVEVISIMQDFGPKRGVIWIRCPGERMQKSGPVQGMSGSPIYLWSENEPKILGKGGKLIGAFAFGYGATKDCYVGVQPIDLMRDTGSRAPNQSSAQLSQRSPVIPSSTLKSLLQKAASKSRFRNNLWRAEVLYDIQKTKPGTVDERNQLLSISDLPNSLAGGGELIPLGMPLMIPWQDVADSLQAILQPLGFNPVTANGTFTNVKYNSLAGKPPPHVDIDTVKLEPGSALSIPLAFGDLDLSAIGTVTEVLPDGTVLAFGHSMFSQGRISLPMATGYVHMVMPSIISSFKLGGSGLIRGAIVQDESSAVVGQPGGKYETASININVRLPHQEPEEYQYQVIRHPKLTPILAGVSVINSIGAVSDLPQINTMHLHGQLQFSNGHTIDINSRLVDPTRVDILVQLVMLLSTIESNPHKPIHLNRVRLSVEVEASRQSAIIMHAHMRQNQVNPGQKVDLDLRLHPYNKPESTKTIQFTVPQHLRDGEYQLTICDAPTYIQLLFDSHPHLLRTSNLQELMALLQRIMSVNDDALYMMLHLPEPSLAVGRLELPQLPSSRRSLIETASSTLTSNYLPWIEMQHTLEDVPVGVAQFMLTVKADQSNHHQN